jgi:hypothetical protein
MPPEPVVLVVVDMVVVVPVPVVPLLVVELDVLPPPPTVVGPEPVVVPESEPEQAAHPMIKLAPAAPQEIKLRALIDASSSKFARGLSAFVQAMSRRRRINSRDRAMPLGSDYGRSGVFLGTKNTASLKSPRSGYSVA